jgi:hypothetical protein
MTDRTRLTDDEIEATAASHADDEANYQFVGAKHVHEQRGKLLAHIAVLVADLRACEAERSRLRKALDIADDLIEDNWDRLDWQSAGNIKVMIETTLREVKP